MTKENMAHIYIHNGILLSHKQNEIMLFAAVQMDLEIIMPSEVSQTDIIPPLICEILKKNNTNELIYKAEIDPRAQKSNLWLPKQKEERGIDQEFGINIYTV